MFTVIRRDFVIYVKISHRVPSASDAEFVIFVFCMMLWSFQFFHKHFGFSLELLFPNVVVEVHVNTLTTHSRDVRRCMIENMTISV